MKWLRIASGLAAATMVFGGNPAAVSDFGTLSLDQLANIKVTSFTGKQQRLSQVAGAVYVITQEQIARSGLTSVPELLRLAPGIDVARVNGNQWSISARGTTGVYSNKLLVLIDGRSIYSPIFSGVYWELGMPLLDTIERIEVIRGPGATLWGANAVLGVVNIITKSARDTRGTTITAGGGSAERAFGSVRTGGTAGSTSYRVYAGSTDEASLHQIPGMHSNDGWKDVQGGFRLDGAYKRNSWTIGGDLFRATENEIGITVSLPMQSVLVNQARFDSAAGNLTGEWRRSYGETGELRVSSYYDYENRPEPQAFVKSTGTFDISLQYDFAIGSVHSVSVGGGERLYSDKIVGKDVTFSPPTINYSNSNAFAQDELHFLHDSLLFTVGAKLEHNYFSGLGADPSANLIWIPREHHSLWISAARSLRTPSLFEIAVNAPVALYPASPSTFGLPVLVNLMGSPAFGAESVKDVEAGYRGQLSKTFSADLTVFYDRFSDVRTFATGNPVILYLPVPYLAVKETPKNGAQAVGKGAEGSIAWQYRPAWKVEGSYTYDIVSRWLNASAPSGSVDAGGRLPSRHKWRLQSYLNLSKAWTLDTFLYWTSRADPTAVPGLPSVLPEALVESYLRLDVRLGYKLGPHCELSLAGQNLLQSHHLEALSELLTAYSYVNRGIYLKSTWQF